MKKYRCPLCGCKEWREYDSVGFFSLHGWGTARKLMQETGTDQIADKPPKENMGGVFFDIKICKACRFMALVAFRMAEPEEEIVH